MNKLDEKLNNLVKSGVIDNFKIENVSEDGKVNEYSNCRNVERLTIHFCSGDILRIETLCSGCSEDSVFILAND